MRISMINTNNGFTFIEVVTVLVLVGIFTAVAIVQHTTTDPTLIVQSQILQSHIRYAQMRSINSDVLWGIEYHHNTGNPTACYYELYRETPGNIVTLPGETDRLVDLCDMGITIAWDIGGTTAGHAFTLSFDSWGQPHMNSQPATTDDVAMSLSMAGHTSQQWTITKNTGFIR